MSLKIYNTMTRKKEEFQPIEEGKVKMYVCGPTVYDFLHVGNFRGPVVFNMIWNWLEYKGYSVTFVHNYTDVDDKILQRASERGEDPKVLAERYIKEYQTDFAHLGLRMHSLNPKVSDHIPHIVEFVADLIEKKRAYEVDGDVYFDVKSFDEYGKLSNKNVDEMASGYRIDIDQRKKHESDFALWKKAKDGEVSWASPWGEGRPGWHIECSVMCKENLGEAIDIHGGGMDLIFPHHENEIAQSESCSGHTFAKYWVHWNMLNLGDKKMSKSLGNITSFREFSEAYTAEVYKFLILRAHHRSLVDFSDEQVSACIASLAKFYSALSLAESICATPSALAPVNEDFQKRLSEADETIQKAMDDDFNTPVVWAQFFEVLKLFNNLCNKPGKVKPQDKAVAEVFLAWLKNKGKMFSLFQMNPSEYLKTLDDLLLEQKGVKRSEVDELVNQRWEAKKNKNFQVADDLRNQLTEMGILVKDSAESSVWEVQK